MTDDLDMIEQTGEAITAALVALARHNIRPDIQELLIYGDPMQKVPPRALHAAIAAALQFGHVEIGEANHV